MNTRPGIPAELESDLRNSKVTIRYLLADGKLKEVRGIGSSPGYGGVYIELRPYLVVEEEIADDPADPADGCHSEQIADIQLEDVVEIKVENEVEYGHIQPVSRWLRNRNGLLKRFSLK